MVYLLLSTAVIIFVCVLLNNASYKIGMPVLLAFILFGMLAGSSRLFGLESEDFSRAEQLCTVALIFIMFYGGFGTNWKSAKSVALESGLLSTVGVALTAGITGVFCRFVLEWGWVESMLMGSVVASTDAASVFSILRSRKLGLKNNIAPMLEVESGSNDPCSYMLTIIFLSVLNNEISGWKVVWTLFSQLAFGAGCGFLIAKAAVYSIRRMSFATSGFDSLFVLAVAIFSYALPTSIGGNGYLSAYIVGIVLGNTEFAGKRQMVGFFDGITGLMQVLIFFDLGLLVRPEMMPKVILPALAIFLVMLLVSRPVSVAAILAPFKYRFKQRLLVSFVGLRGAASIVFAIMVTEGAAYLQNDILNIVFCIVLLSIALQGSLIPFVARKLDMIDDSVDVMKTFSDFSDETDLHFSEVPVTAGSSWKDRKLKDLNIPKSVLICTVIKKGGARIIPNGDTVLSEGDKAILCSKAFKSDSTLNIIQHTIGSEGDGITLKEHPFARNQIILIKRGDTSIIPNGGTVLRAGDILFINKA